MSWFLLWLRRCWVVLWVGKQPEERAVGVIPAPSTAPRRSRLAGHPYRSPLADRSLGLCDACSVAWGVEMWLHPDQLLVTVLCWHHSTDQQGALLEHGWSRLVEADHDLRRPRAEVTRTSGA